MWTSLHASWAHSQQSHASACMTLRCRTTRRCAIAGSAACAPALLLCAASDVGGCAQVHGRCERRLRWCVVSPGGMVAWVDHMLLS